MKRLVTWLCLPLLAAVVGGVTPPRPTVLAWENEDYGEDNAMLETGIQASTDLAVWQEIAVMRYRPQNTLVLNTQRGAGEFYRAFNRNKQR